MKRLLPDFVVIGAGKSGTTSLNNYLEQHPDIFMSRMKEPDFFAYEKMDPSGLKDRDLIHYERAIKNIDDYSALFEDAGPGQLKGETSNTCLSYPKAAERIKHYIPDAKLIAILRQPTDRLYSRFMHLVRINLLPDENFSEVLNKNSIWWERKDLVPEGFYYENLKSYYQLFPSENIHVILTEDLKVNPQIVIKNICSFLGVDPEADINLDVEFNKSGFVKNKTYDKVLGNNSIIKKTLRQVTPVKTYHKLKQVPWLQKTINKMNAANLEKRTLDPKLFDQVTTEIYSEDIKKLSGLIGRDLSHWLAPKSKVY